MKKVYLFVLILFLLLTRTGYSQRNTLIGIFTPEFPPRNNLIQLEDRLGSQFDIIAWYQQWSVAPITNKLLHTCEMRRIPLITWESWSGRSSGHYYSLHSIISGAHDELIMENLRAWNDTASDGTCPEIWIRFNHEMNTHPGVVSWYPWQGNPQAYREAWQHIVGMAQEHGFTRLRWIFSPAWGNADALLYYPGAEYVDMIGTTTNQYWNPTNGHQWGLWEEYWQGDAQILESFGKPIVIAETATGEGIDSAAKAEWIANMFDTVNVNPQIIAVVWFNNYSSRQFEDVNFRLDSSDSAFETFASYMNR